MNCQETIAAMDMLPFAPDPEKTRRAIADHCQRCVSCGATFLQMNRLEQELQQMPLPQLQPITLEVRNPIGRQEQHRSPILLKVSVLALVVLCMGQIWDLVGRQPKDFLKPLSLRLNEQIQFLLDGGMPGWLMVAGLALLALGILLPSMKSLR